MVREVKPLDEEAPQAGTATKARGSGVSGTVLDDLSGSYKTFAEAIKEVISNAYDADAKKVELIFDEGFTTLEIRDDGAGMNPKQFVREYIRVGRSADAKRLSPSGARERIGGKGIGSLAPARYCQRLEVRTKSKRSLEEAIELTVPHDGQVALDRIFPYLALDASLLHLFTAMSYQVVGEGVEESPVSLTPALTLNLPPEKRCIVAYRFAANEVWLQGGIDFVRLRELGEHINLDQVVDLWELHLVPATEEDRNSSGTTLVLSGLEEFVTSDLRAPGKAQARNISSMSGLERFEWTLSRLCPVPVVNRKNQLQESFPEQVADLLQARETLQVFISRSDVVPKFDQLKRQVYIPHRPLKGHDASLCKILEFDEPDLGLKVRGYVMGSTTIIYPAELRGISIRVNGVELGAPTLFGADSLVSGPQHAALANHITGELHLEGVQVRRDILPGREGLYPESPVYRTLRRAMVGTEDRLGGLLRELVSEVLLRSEANASAQGLIKKLESQRKALLDAASSIATMAEMDEFMLERLMTPPEDDLQLLLYPDVEVRPEGRLAAYTIEYAEQLHGSQYEIDYDGRRLVLPTDASYRHNTVDIAGERFKVRLKQGARERVFCEVDPDSRNIFINWDHPVRGAMGDSAYIKHCLAAVVCGLPQMALNRYVQLISSRS